MKDSLGLMVLLTFDFVAAGDTKERESEEEWRNNETTFNKPTEKTKILFRDKS